MKLQVALDFGTLDECRKILGEIEKYVDIVEIGAISVEYGYEALKTLKAEFPKPEYLVDLKVADGGAYFVEQAAAKGADYVTVLGITEDETIKGAVEAGKKTGTKVVVDMLGCKNFYERIKSLDTMGVDYISIHTPADIQANHTPFEDLKFASMLVKNAKLSVAGGINEENIVNVLPYKPDIVICGSALTFNEDRIKAAERIRSIIDRE